VGLAAGRATVTLGHVLAAAAAPTLGGAVRLTRTLLLRAHCSALRTAPRELANALSAANAPRHVLPAKAGALSSMGFADVGAFASGPSGTIGGAAPGAGGAAALATAAARAALLAPPLHVYAPAQLQTLAVTFPELLAQAFPLTTADERARVEVDTVPDAALAHYAAFFDAIDAEATHYLSLERLKAAQLQFRALLATAAAVAVAGGGGSNNNMTSGSGDHQRRSLLLDGSGGALVALAAQERRRRFPLAEHDAAQAQTQLAATGRSRLSGYEQRLQAAVAQPWVARWQVLDIQLTVALAKSVDKQRTGFVSLAELLRYAFPSVPCVWTRDRLSGARGDEASLSCRCSICRFCGARYTKPRPASPYLDGSAAW
jgi:hypothetical protein